ncbi:hypothetical protein LQ327_08835 [Actinomycetospora endophytica]|uniref:Uncharacterized protein n=1 Tax=Actinomycetospora endophytica TaxID=2291215 RepID=A0ABS8P5G3_9PSEU|nr:hypothetical protein [Actinomycetospora endophytica]MCD2193486.1 hypothetical protein [Actinomycetospora endophytica]
MNAPVVIALLVVACALGVTALASLAAGAPVLALGLTVCAGASLTGATALGGARR